MQYWTAALIVRGKLTGIDRKKQGITVEYFDGQSASHWYSTEDWSDEDYESLRGSLGETILLTVEDQRAVGWEPV